MTATTPRALHELFTECFNKGDLDALVSLYEPTAVLLPQPGVRAEGKDAIRASLASFLAMEGEFRMAEPRVIEAPDLAIIYSDWTLKATGSDGKPLQLAGQTTDVARRQSDGRWLLAIDSPFGASGIGP